jgi:hypothetical protein
MMPELIASFIVRVFGKLNPDRKIGKITTSFSIRLLLTTDFPRSRWQPKGVAGGRRSPGRKP